MNTINRNQRLENNQIKFFIPTRDDDLSLHTLHISRIVPKQDFNKQFQTLKNQLQHERTLRMQIQAEQRHLLDQNRMLTEQIGLSRTKISELEIALMPIKPKQPSLKPKLGNQQQIAQLNSIIENFKINQLINVNKIKQLENMLLEQRTKCANLNQIIRVLENQTKRLHLLLSEAEKNNNQRQLTIISNSTANMQSIAQQYEIQIQNLKNFNKRLMNQKSTQNLTQKQGQLLKTRLINLSSIISQKNKEVEHLWKIKKIEYQNIQNQLNLINNFQ